MSAGIDDPRPATDMALRPAVAPPRDLLPLPVALGILAVLALALFLFLNARREAVQLTPATAARVAGPLPPLMVPTPPPPPPLAVAPPVVVPPPVLPLFLPPPHALPTAGASPAPPPGSGQPALVIDLTPGNGASVNGAAIAGGAAGVAAGATAGLDDETARATQIRNRASVIPQGAVIAAVLETPLDSDRPGLARALVSQDARGFDGSRVLIPRGSRLIGEFKADPSPNLRRILVTWNRLIRPDGVAIRIGSPVSDPLGGAGVPGHVNTHFLSRFTDAILQSALAVGVNLASQSSSTNAIYVGLPTSAGQVGASLVPNTVRPPTIKVREGVEIAVFVARDLDFSGTPPVH